MYVLCSQMGTIIPYVTFVSYLLNFNSFNLVLHQIRILMVSRIMHIEAIILLLLLFQI